ncbi:MAG: hypothetical protein J4215_06375 [Candidatus Diapherotrites archaeon]|uniref:Uncharacterized protein n=1 Tax=Candidatus Iainarchaeum sp. TaxID=3101447 RepID=A0A8T4L9F2_9ARCH|nr:hypothetical protein [Candidatus Diapherotrites archaeon]
MPNMYGFNPMGLLSNARKFLAQLFSGRTPKPVELSFVEVEAWVAKTSEQEFGSLSNNAITRFSEIRFLTSQLKIGFSALKTQPIETQKGNPALRKVVSSSQHALSERMDHLLSKLEPPRLVDFSTVSTYCLTAYPVLQKEILSMRKDIAYTGILLQKEVKGIGENFAELEQILSELFKAFSESPVTSVLPSVSAGIRRIKELQDKNREIKTETSRLRSAQLELEQEHSDVEKKYQSETDSSTAQRLTALKKSFDELLQEQQELEQQLLVRLEPVDKPLRRLYQMVESKTEQNESVLLRQELALYLSTLTRSPSSAFKSDPKGVLFKEILVELKQAIDSDVIHLKEKEKERAIQAIFALAEYDFFDQFFWKHNKCEVEKQKIEKELKSSVFFMNLQAIETELKRLQDRKKNIETEQSKLHAALEKNRTEISRDAKQLGELLSSIRGGPVSVLI